MGHFLSPHIGEISNLKQSISNPYRDDYSISSLGFIKKIVY